MSFIGNDLIEIFRVARFHFTWQRAPERDVQQDHLLLVKKAMEEEANNLDCIIRWHEETRFLNITPTSQRLLRISLIPDDRLRRNLFHSSESGIDFTLEHSETSEQFHGRVLTRNSPFEHYVKLELDGEEPVEFSGGGPFDFVMLSSKGWPIHEGDVASGSCSLFYSKLMHHPDNRLQLSALKMYL